MNKITRGESAKSGRRKAIAPRMMQYEFTSAELAAYAACGDSRATICAKIFGEPAMTLPL